MERERQREQERWRREDEARTFEHRREVFEDFYQAVKALARRSYDHGYGFDDTPELPFDWNADAAAKMNRLKLYVDRRSYIAAEHAYDAAFVGHHTKYNDPDDPSSTSGNRSSTMPSSSCWYSCAKRCPYPKAIPRYRHLAIATRTGQKEVVEADSDET